MKRGSRVLALVAPFALATAAFAQPAVDLDLGTLTNPQTAGGSLTGFVAGQVKWVRFEIPSMTRVAAQFLDINTNGGSLTGNDSHIGLFNSTGAFIASNDDTGPGAYSQLSFGDTAPARAAIAATGNAVGAGGTRTGSNGPDLPAGVYYLAVTGFGGNTYAAGWTVGTTHTRTGDVDVRVGLGTDASASTLAGAGAFTSVLTCPNSPRLFTVAVTPGNPPLSSGISVSANLSAAGGSASQAFFNDGTNGDAVAGDSTWSYLFTPTTPGSFAAMPFTVTDAQARTGNGTFGTFAVSSTCVSGTPAVFEDLGALASTTFTDTSETFTANGVKWYRFSVGAVNNVPLNFLDIWTSAGATITDSELGLWTNAGVLVTTDDDEDTGLFSALSYGDSSAPRAANGTGVAFNGRDGTLAAGTYWLSVSPFNTNFGTANWQMDLTSTATGTIVTNIRYSDATLPTPPSGTGTGGNVGACGGTVLAAVTVTPGTNPVSTGVTVTLDASAAGGSSTQALLDNGSNGDVTAGDGIYSANISVAGGGDATFNLPFTVADAQARSSNGSLTVTRSGVEVGDLPASAKTYYGLNTPATTLASTIANGTDVDMYALCVSDPANFGANVIGGATFDTQLFLFNADGTGAAMNDDEPGAGTALQSNLQLNLGVPPIVLPSGGLYFLAIAPYDRDPITSGTATDTIWADQGGTPAAFDAVWAPNGVTPTAPVVAWNATGNAGGAYTITLTNAGTVCPADLSNTNLTARPDCAVDINDLLFFLAAFEAGNADIADVNVTGNPDCATDINDLLFFLSSFEGGC